jgi:Zn-dependent protease with chaperone function
MIVAGLLLTGVVLVTAPGLALPSPRVRASLWARVAAAGLIIGFAAIEASLTMIALPAVLAPLHAAGLAAVCDWATLTAAPGGAVVGWIAAGIAVTLALRAWRAAREAHRRACAATAEPWFGRHEARTGYELVVLPTDEVLAMSVPGASPQVVISDGLVERLAAEELDVVVRHEEMHHRLHHWRYSMLASAVEQSLRPLPVRRAASSLRAALEAWADEAATGLSPQSRSLVRRSLTTLGVDAGHHATSWGSRLNRDRLRRLSLSTHERLHRLLAPRFVFAVPALALMAAVAVLLGIWASGAQHAVALSGNC